mgnify:CR=1 FL=1
MGSVFSFISSTVKHIVVLLAKELANNNYTLSDSFAQFPDLSRAADLFDPSVPDPVSLSADLLAGRCLVEIAAIHKRIKAVADAVCVGDILK